MKTLSKVPPHTLVRFRINGFNNPGSGKIRVTSLKLTRIFDSYKKNKIKNIRSKLRINYIFVPKIFREESINHPTQMQSNTVFNKGMGNTNKPHFIIPTYKWKYVNQLF